MTWFFSSTWKNKIKILMQIIEKNLCFSLHVKHLTICCAIEESEFKWVHQQPLWKLCNICAFKYWSPFNQYCCHIFYEDKNTLTSIIHLEKLVILHLEVVGHDKNILVKFRFSICNHQLFLTLAIPSSLYINNDDNNGSKARTLNITSKYPNGICV